MPRLSVSLCVSILVALACSAATARESWVGLNLRAQPVYIEMNQFNAFNMGVGGEASFFPFARLQLEGRYSKSVFANGNASDYESYYEEKASPELKPFTYWEAGGQINLIVKSGMFGNTATRVDSVRYDTNWATGRTTRSTYMSSRKFLAAEHQLYGIRGGIFQLESGMAADLGADDDVILFPDSSAVDPAFRDLTFTNHKMQGYYVGLAKTRVYYREGLWRTVYVDALVSTKTEYRDPELSGFTERKVGGRVGLEGARRHIGGRLEAGVRPGVDKLYLLTQLSVGVML